MDEKYVVCIGGYVRDGGWEDLLECHFDTTEEAFRFFDADSYDYIRAHYSRSDFEGIGVAIYDDSYSNEPLESHFYSEDDLKG